MFAISDAWLMQHSKAAAWTRDQLSCIGVEWPPPRGWKRRVIGKTISDDSRRRFERAMRSRQARWEATQDMFT